MYQWDHGNLDLRPTFRSPGLTNQRGARPYERLGKLAIRAFERRVVLNSSRFVYGNWSRPLRTSMVMVGGIRVGSCPFRLRAQQTPHEICVGEKRTYSQPRTHNDSREEDGYAEL